MKARAILIALAVHLALIGGAIYAYHRTPSPDSSENLVIEAPLGDVFVQEEKLAANPPPTPPDSPAEPPSPDPAAPSGFPSEVKQPNPSENEAATSEKPGLPEGEASPLGQIEPVYPALSRKMGEEGEAAFLLGIDADGSVSSVTLEKSSGHPRLDDSARDALLAARFHPVLSGGAPVLSMKRYRVEFRLSAAKKN